MTHVATKRLIEASVNLGASDRALLNLLVHHGVDDAALSRLLRVSEPEAAARRELLAERLSEQLGLPPEDVQRELERLIQTAREPAPEPAPADEPSPARESPASAPRRGAIRAAAAALVAVVVIAVVALSSGSGSPHRTVAKRDAHPQAKRELPLATLPGTASAAHGRISVTGGSRPRLTVSITGLPSAGTGHYEVWLYNSIIDAQPLASLGSSGRTITVALPAGYRRYRWLDVSRQASGSPYDSGNSVLRAALPS